MSFSHQLIYATAAKRIGDPLAFYTVVATVIPVLYIAVVYQAPILAELSKLSKLSRVSYVGLTVAAALAALGAMGEVYAVGALLSRAPDRADEVLCIVAVASLGTWVVTIPLLISIRDLPRRRRWVVCSIIAVLVTLVWTVGLVVAIASIG